MNKVMFVGNGFDLAHDLLTSYGDFLEVMQCWNQIYKTAKNVNKGYLYADNWYLEKYIINAANMNMDNLAELDRIIQTNSWVYYFCNCEAEIDGWIDFEREIYPVIDLFKTLFSIKDDISSKEMAEISANKNYFNSRQIKLAKIWNTYLSTSADRIVYVKPDYVSKQYGILKKKILQSLKKEFDEFIKAFEIYLLEFVYSVEHKDVLKQIKKIKADYVISCNYTRTEELYGIDKNNVHHLHGVIREDIKEDDDGKNVNGKKNNVVMGVNEQKDQNMDFIYFVKYFQRIQKASGTRYKDFVKDEYELHVYGHSLDETDKDILKNIIGDKTEKGDFFYKPRKIYIYYYNQSDYEQKVINLIKLYGRPIVEAYMENGVFEFVPTDSIKCAI